jgi:hypothetical protein
MKSPRDVLTRLSSLAEKDRVWILARLPADAKARLLEGRRAVPPPEPSSPPTPLPGANELEARSPRRLLSEVDAARVCHALRTEPAWVLAAILKVQVWPWQAKLLASLSESTRLEVQRLVSVTYTTQMLDSIVRLAQQKVADCGAPSRNSRFARLAAKLSAARARKRWSVYP